MPPIDFKPLLTSVPLFRYLLSQLNDPTSLSPGYTIKALYVLHKTVVSWPKTPYMHQCNYWWYWPGHLYRKGGWCWGSLFSSATFPVTTVQHRLTSYSERDSPRDQLIVTVFVLLVIGLLLGAGIKKRMEKAGFDSSRTWQTGRRWWEVSDERFEGQTSFFNLYFPDVAAIASARRVWIAKDQSGAKWILTKSPRPWPVCSIIICLSHVVELCTLTI